MQAIAKADRLGALEQLDAIENAAAHVAGSLERIDALAGHQHRLLSGRQHAGDAGVLLLAQQAAADRGLRHQRHIEIDEGIAGRPGLGSRGCHRVARIDEGLVDFADGQVQVAHRSLREQGVPVDDRAGLRVEGARRAGSRCTGGGGTQLQRTRHPHGRSRDTLAHHQHRHGGAADDVGMRRALALGARTQGVVADERGQVVDHALLGNADQHDRFTVRNQFQADDGAGRIEPDDDLDRLARVAIGVDELRIQVDVAEQFVTAIRGCDGRVGTQRAETVGTGHDLRGPEPGEELPEACRSGLRHRDGPAQPCNEQQRELRDRQPCCSPAQTSSPCIASVRLC